MRSSYLNLPTVVEHCNLLGGKLVNGGDLSVRFDRPTDLKFSILSSCLACHRQLGFLFTVGAVLLTRLSTGRMTGFFDVSPRHAMSSDYVPVVCYLHIAKAP